VSLIRPFSRKKLRREAKGKRRIGKTPRLDSSNRVHILNAGCSEHSAAACPGALVRFERLRRYIRNDLPPPPPPPSSSLLLRSASRPPVSVSLLFLLFSRGEALSNRCPEFHIDAGDGERPSSSYIIIEQNIMLANERPAAKMYYDRHTTTPMQHRRERVAHRRHHLRHHLRHHDRQLSSANRRTAGRSR